MVRQNVRINILLATHVWEPQHPKGNNPWEWAKNKLGAMGTNLVHTAGNSKAFGIKDTTQKLESFNFCSYFSNSASAAYESRSREGSKSRTLKFLRQGINAKKASTRP
jgi:hypothetical protein